METNTIAVAEGFGGDGFDFRNFANARALQVFAEDGTLHFDLSLVDRVLIMTTAALAKVRAGRLSARWARFENGLKLRGGKPALVGNDFRLDSFTGESKGNKDSFAVVVGEARSAIDGFLDEQLHSCLI